MIIDDDSEVLKSIKRFLGVRGFEVETIHVRSQSLEEVRGQIDPTKCDVVLSDMDMPPFSGLQLVAALRQAGVSTPFILQSAYISEGFKAQLESRKAHGQISDFGEKPWSLEALVSALIRAAGRDD